MKYSLFLLIVFFAFNILKAQEIKFLESTKQHWASGVCCSSGINYVIALESTDTSQFITIDTIWIGKQFYVENQLHSFTIFKAILNGKTRYQIQIAEIWNKNGFNEIKVNELEQTINPPKYKGDACIQYHSKDQKKIISIENFINIQELARP